MDAQSLGASAPNQSPIVALHRLIKCRVNVRTISGDKHHYTALFPSTCGAAMDALGRFGISKISVEAIKQ